MVVIALDLGSLQVSTLDRAGKSMNKITGSDENGIGHYCTIGYALSGAIGGLVGSPEDSTEKLKLPKWMGFFRDYVGAISLTMLIFYYIAAVAAGREAVEAISGGQNWLLVPFVQSLTFAGAVYVIITGVRMFLGEIVPAFLGISDKLTDANALDCRQYFPMLPRVIIGFWQLMQLV